LIQSKRWHYQATLGLSFVLLATRGLHAANEFIVTSVTLDAFIAFHQPSISSYALGALYNGASQRIYSQVILGHDIVDENSSLRYHAQIVSAVGYANNRTGNLDGDFDRCYQARMAGHANAYNLHVADYASIKCTPPITEDPQVEIPKENCPVLLDLEQDGFHLSGTDHPVNFDIDADGSLDSIAWTQSGEDDAFLCLDRNNNGIIDDGTELFGYATPLLSGNRARVGYRALAELDKRELGGNRDGRVDATDPLFHALCAWVDVNRDGISQPSEIHGLDAVGVLALDYKYSTTRIIDSFGNLFRYVSHVGMRTPSGVVKQWPTFDVIFAEP
jgi:hypothetical protein